MSKLSGHNQLFPEFLNNKYIFFQVIAYLEKKVRSKGARTYIPPAFFGRDGSFYQPPAFEMPSTIFQNEVNEKDI